ncbi:MULTISPECIES: hypothetical protein [unclassified Sphingomonas]|uniref:hypothetical protein n=1 Tax=unclassified Sphingomonas TaxID=196159 RepID=UPI00082BA7B0|nr:MULTISPECIES: hypothetical protein [unclassified Sphingomonas]
MLFATTVFVMMILRLWPETPIARWLHRTLVAAPARRLSALSRQQLLFMVALVMLLPVGGELMLIFGAADALMLMAWQTAAYYDAMMATALLAGLARMRGIAAVVRSARHARSVRSSRARQRRTRTRIKRPGGGADGDRPGPAPRHAANDIGRPATLRAA